MLNCGIVEQKCRNRRNAGDRLRAVPILMDTAYKRILPSVGLDVDVKNNNMNLIGSLDVKIHAHIRLRLFMSLVCHNFSLFCLFLVLIL
jgi:hypothetical protein